MAPSTHSEWLSLIDISGPFLSLSVLDRAFPNGLDGVPTETRQGLRKTYDEWIDACSGRRPDLPIHQAWVRWVLRFVLHLPDDAIRAPDGDLASLNVPVPEQGETLRPNLVIADPDSGRPRILVMVVPPGQGLERPLGGARWKEVVTTRMMTLLHGTGVRMGLLTNGEQWMLVDAPMGETTGFISWYARLWLEEQITLRAFTSILGANMLFGRPDDETLEALLQKSSTDQQEVTDQLGRQVRQAVELLVAAVDQVNQERGDGLLDDVGEERLYAAALTVMMRLVFLLAAEERGMLMPDDDVYIRNYAISTMLPALQELATHGEELLEHRHDAWVQLLATFRAIHGGIRHVTLRLPAYGGSLFDPEQYPFLEGRVAGQPLAEARPLPISNRVVLHMLRSLQLLQMKGRKGTEARRLSFRALGIEQIGHVYEGLLDHTARRATTPVLGLIGTQDTEPEVELLTLEELASRDAKVQHAPQNQSAAMLPDDSALLAFLQEQTGRSANALRKAIATPDEQQLAYIRAACGGDEALFQRIVPFAGLVRTNTFGRPVVIPTGSVYVTAGDERRKTGTHYTPTSLTEPIVRHTLEPVVYRGPAEGQPREEWKLIPLAALLNVKVCDMAMGSGAFLVQACRYLSERVVEAIEVLPAGAIPGGLDEGARTLVAEIQVAIEGEERLALARRLVVDRCLYGVDKNPLAVEMAKLSLWLITLDRARPFTFLDHALKSGDSLLGIADVEQLTHWTLRTDYIGLNRNHLYYPLERALKRALALRRRIRETPVSAAKVAEQKRAWLVEADETLGLVHLAADLLVATALHPEPKLRESLRTSFLERIAVAADAFEAARSGVPGAPSRAGNDAELAVLRREAHDLLQDRKPFHWPLEFPEVFIEEVRAEAPGTQFTLDGFGNMLAPLFAQLEEQPFEQAGIGFSAVVGNPPFMGGQKITGALGTSYRDYLVEYLARGQRGSADICAYFFLRAGVFLGQTGVAGLLATNTIAQGDTREVGFDQLIKDGYIFLRAVSSRTWPGLAAVEVAHVWLRYGDWRGDIFLNEQLVPAISSFLSISGAITRKPYRLKLNDNKSFIGSFTQGSGFSLEINEARDLIIKNEYNKDVLFPFINGEDFNTRHDQSASKWIINFFDWPLSKAESYPDCLQIVKDRVYPERMKHSDNRLRKNWWLYKRPTIELYSAIANKDRVLFHAFTSKYLAFGFVKSNMVFSAPHVVVNLDDYGHFACLQSSIHEGWVLEYCSTLETRLRYAPSDLFETFPFPKIATPAELSGKLYHKHRRQIMLARQEGLTKTYNRFHDRSETSADIAELRRLHVVMDQAVAAAYGWDDLDLGHSFHETKQGLRYTISEAARRSVLDRLLALNHQRYAEEVAAGLHEKAIKKVANAKRAAQPKEQSTLPGLGEAQQPTFAPSEGQHGELMPAEKVIDFQAIARQRLSDRTTDGKKVSPPATTAPLFHLEEEQRVTELSPADRHVILLARIIQIHHEKGLEKTLGRVKVEKISHLVESHCHTDLGRTPMQAAAGPADFQHLLSIIARGKAQGAFYERERKHTPHRSDSLWDFYDHSYPGNKSYEYIALPGLEQTASQMTRAFGSRVTDIDSLITNLTGLNSDQSEVVATLYAIWNDLLAARRNGDLETLRQEFLNWDKSKKRLEGYIVPMIAWMNDTNIIPNGTGKKTIPSLRRRGETVIPLSTEQEMLYRQVKALLKEQVLITAKMVEDRLGVDKESAQLLLRRLVDDKLARQERGWEGIQYRLV